MNEPSSTIIGMVGVILCGSGAAWVLLRSRAGVIRFWSAYKWPDLRFDRSPRLFVLHLAASVLFFVIFAVRLALLAYRGHFDWSSIVSIVQFGLVVTLLITTVAHLGLQRPTDK